MALQLNNYTVSYQSNTDECPTLELKSPSKNDQDSDFSAVEFINSEQAFGRHLSTASTDTQSSSNNLIMSQQAEESSPLRETRSDPFSVPRFLRHFEGIHLIITTMVVAAVSITIALIVQIYTGTPQIIPHGGIVSSSGYCSKFSFATLQSSEASSVDAAILTALCICITHPHAAGIGGGGFAMVHNQKLVKKATHVFDFRESSPEIFSNESFRNDYFEGKLMDDVEDKYTVAVPGVLKGLQKLHSDHGRLPWKVLLQQAATIAKGGFPVSKGLAEAIEDANISRFSPNLQSLLRKPNDTNLNEGDQLKMPELAIVLENIAINGAESLYSGSLLENFISQITANGGVVAESDLKQYEVKPSFNIRETRFSDFKIVTSGPPSFGFALHAVMDTMALYPQHPSEKDQRFMQVHRMIEAIKIGRSLMAQLGDPSRPNYTAPAFYNNASLGLNIKNEINDDTAFPLQHYLGDYQPLQLTGKGQQYVSVIGPDGFVVLIALSLGSPFGSGTMASGIILNDAMRDFSWTDRSTNFADFLPSQANYLTGNARPMSSLLPVLVIPGKTKCGEYIVPACTPGGVSLSSLIQTIVYDRQRQLQAAIVSARFDYVISNDTLLLESDPNSDLPEFLVSKNHSFAEAPAKSIGIVNAVQWYENIVKAFVDNRNPDNVALDY